MKSFGAVAGWLVCVLVSAVAVAQSDSTPKGSGKAEQESNKSTQTTKKTSKDPKKQPPKSTGKKPVGGGVNSDEASVDLSAIPDEQNVNVANPVKTKVVEPNWSVGALHIEPHAAKFTRDAVTLEPTEGQSLVQAKFHLKALHPDAKAVERYSRVWSAVDRKELTRRAKVGARVLESKNIVLLSPDGKRYPALWSLDEGIRTTIIHAEFSPNSQSSRQNSSGTTNPAGSWLDAEQSFMTRIRRPFNQPPITEYATVFTGLLRTDLDVPLTFLFSIPAGLDLQSLKLVIDSDTFSFEE